MPRPANLDKKAHQAFIRARISAILIVAAQLIIFGFISGGGVGKLLVALFVALVICMFADKYIVMYTNRHIPKP